MTNLKIYFWGKIDFALGLLARDIKHNFDQLGLTPLLRKRDYLNFPPLSFLFNRFQQSIIAKNTSSAFVSLLTLKVR